MGAVAFPRNGRNYQAGRARARRPIAQDALIPRPYLYSQQVRKWTDGSTALLYSELSVMGEEDPRWVTTFLFTLKFDAQGNWKIIKSHQMSDKEIEKEDAPKDVSGAAQTLIRRRPVQMRVSPTPMVTLMRFITRCALAFPHQSATG